MQPILHIRTARFEEMDFLLSQAKNEGWNPGLSDAIPFYQADPHGFFIGELEQEKIGCISAVAYNNNYGFIGFYIVIPKYRGQGYGLTLWNHAIHYLGNRCIGLDGVIDQQENYKKSHFELYFKNIRFKGKGFKNPNTKLIDTNSIPFETLFAYDKKIFGIPRKSFLQSWLQMPNSYSLAKFENNQLKGYGIIRKCYEGYKIGPLFADNKNIAHEIYDGLSSKVCNEVIYIDIPAINKDALEIVEKLKLKKTFETARMYTKIPPKQDLNRIFGITTFELG
jgi:GNAT superfamily N-acetyltransferase